MARFVSYLYRPEAALAFRCAFLVRPQYRRAWGTDHCAIRRATWNYRQTERRGGDASPCPV